MKQKIVIKIFILFLSGALIFSNLYAKNVLKLATTTSLYDSGLLDYIIPDFEKKYNIKVHTISVGTGKAIKLGENGDVDIILVHAPESEKKFIEKGYGINRKTFMFNNFIMIGPEDDPAELKNYKEIKLALIKISEKKLPFISRGDESGTHKKEKSLWTKAGIIPQGKWYMESGQGMGATIIIADEKNGYCLTDKAIYLSYKKRIRLINLLERDKNLKNPYSVISVNPDKHPYINYELSMKFTEWITSQKVLKKIKKYKKGGETLFFPYYGIYF